MNEQEKKHLELLVMEKQEACSLVWGDFRKTLKKALKPTEGLGRNKRLKTDEEIRQSLVDAGREALRQISELMPEKGGPKKVEQPWAKEMRKISSKCESELIKIAQFRVQEGLSKVQAGREAAGFWGQIINDLAAFAFEKNPDMLGEILCSSGFVAERFRVASKLGDSAVEKVAEVNAYKMATLWVKIRDKAEMFGEGLFFKEDGKFGLFFPLEEKWKPLVGRGILEALEKRRNDYGSNQNIGQVCKNALDWEGWSSSAAQKALNAIAKELPAFSIKIQRSKEDMESDYWKREAEWQAHALTGIEETLSLIKKKHPTLIPNEKALCIGTERGSVQPDKIKEMLSGYIEHGWMSVIGEKTSVMASLIRANLFTFEDAELREKEDHVKQYNPIVKNGGVHVWWGDVAGFLKKHGGMPKTKEAANELCMLAIKTNSRLGEIVLEDLKELRDLSKGGQMAKLIRSNAKKIETAQKNKWLPQERLVEMEEVAVKKALTLMQEGLSTTMSIKSAKSSHRLVSLVESCHLKKEAEKCASKREKKNSEPESQPTRRRRI